jgi:hypothetical protein
VRTVALTIPSRHITPSSQLRCQTPAVSLPPWYLPSFAFFAFGLISIMSTSDASTSSVDSMKHIQPEWIASASARESRDFRTPRPRFAQNQAESSDRSSQNRQIVHPGLPVVSCAHPSSSTACSLQPRSCPFYAGCRSQHSEVRAACFVKSQARHLSLPASPPPPTKGPSQPTLLRR